MDSEKSYKEFHEHFMHSNGTSPFETVALVSSLPVYLLISNIIVSFVHSFITQKKSVDFLLEFFIIFIPYVFQITVCAEYLKEFILYLLISAFTLVVFVIALPAKFKPIPYPQNGINNVITGFRSFVNIASVLAILAVDFKIFPRRYAKTETFGFSLMDTGVGLFMTANGLVAPELKRQADPLKKTLKSAVPLLIIGGARFFLTREMDYHVPVSEYGVHWNFFITLATVKIFTSCILNVVQIKYIWINAIVLTVAHEIVLQAGLENFVLRNYKRDSFIMANREGIVSSLGYASLYLLSISWSYFVNYNQAKKRNTFIKNSAFSAICLALTIILNNSFGISRKLTNSAYILWILFLSSFLCNLGLIIECLQQYLFCGKFKDAVYVPYILKAINFNGLTYFLLSNVTTGLINICFRTLYLDSITSCCIIIMYMFFNCMIICILHEKKIKLKIV